MAATKTKKKSEQSEKPARAIVTRCRFLKPSAILPTGDDGEPAIKMQFVIPEADIARASVAEDFFHKTRLRVEFSLQSVEKWQPQLPGTEGEYEVVECETDVKGYVRTTTGYKFGFPISTDLIDDNTAVRTYAKREGSCRLTLLGEMEGQVKPEKSTAETMAAARPLQGQKSLLDGEAKKPADGPSRMTMDEHGEFTCPDEFMVPSTVKGAWSIVLIGEHKGVFYPSIACTYIDGEGDSMEEDWGEPKEGKSGHPTISGAIQAAIGWAIDYLTDEEAKPECITDLRKELVRLADGGEPIPMPE
jgi:hypothetical protein